MPNENGSGPAAKQYLGDSVYAEFKGYEIVLTTENGVPFDPSNLIVLEQQVLNALFRFAQNHGWKFPD